MYSFLQETKNSISSVITSRARSKLTSGYNKIGTNSKKYQSPFTRSYLKRVYGPVLLDITVNNDLHATYLQTVLGSFLPMILVQSQEDRDLIYRKLIQERKLELKVVIHFGFFLNVLFR